MSMRLEYILFLAMLLCSTSLAAQNTMRVHYKDGTEQDIFVSHIDSVTFVDKDASEERVSLTGSWLWGSTMAGYYELLSFNEDHTYTGYDNYFTYGFDTMTYGWYSWYGNMLSLQSNGFGYQRIYNWFVIGLTSNALDVMTKMGSFTYYKLQPETLYVPQAGVYSGFASGDSIVFADNVIVKAEDNKLQGLVSGTTYVLVRKASDNKVVAYRVDVE